MEVGAEVVAPAPRVYRLVGVVGRGGFGTVYRADLIGERGFVRPVALKVLDAESEARPELGQRLRDEARLLGLLRHRAIVYVDELVQLDGRWTVVMELVEGADLRRVLGWGPLPAGPALEVVGEVASALAAASSTPGPDRVPLGLLHRDLKPSNVLLTGHGEVKVVDFGVARGRFATREAETLNLMFGSPGYVAPERTELVECAAGDIYSLGVVLYEMVTSRRFGRARASARRHATKVSELLRGAERVPGGVLSLIAEMVQFDPARRPTAREVVRQARALRGELGGMWLADWAAEAFAPMARTASDEPDDRPAPNKTVWEQGPRPGELPTLRIEPPPRLPPAPRAIYVPRVPRPSPPPPSDRRLWALLALLPLPPAVVAGAVALVAGWWFGSA